MNIEYREIELYDALNMIEFLSAVGDETDNLSFSADSLKLTRESEERFIKGFKSSKKNLMLVATLDGKIVANASVERNKTPRFNHRAELSVVVKRELWGKGIGSRLIELLIDFARESGIEILYLEARSDNERALKLYRKFGFSSIGTYKKFFKINNKYHDAELMTVEI